MIVLGNRPDFLVRVDRSWRRAAAVLVGLCVLALLPAVLSPFFADDYFHIEHVAELREALTHGWVLRIDSVGAWWTPPGLSVEYFRPLVVLSFAADHYLYGDHALGYHLTNLVMHVATTLLLWRIARRVIGAGFAAWAASALFAIHPAHTVAVGWISGRTDVLATLLYAAAFLFYLRHVERHSSLGDGGGWLGLSLAAFGLALLAKEMAITFPAVILAHSAHGLRNRPPAGRTAPAIRIFVAPLSAAAVALAYLGIRVHMLGGFHAPPTPFAYHLGDPGLIRHLLVAPLLYLADLVMFVPVDPMATLPFWKAHPLLLGAFVAFILAVFRGTLKKARARTGGAWGLGWMIITLLPVVMLTVGEHFLYLPSMGYCVLVASQLPATPAEIGAKARRALAVVGALVTIVCFARATMFALFARSASQAIDEAAAALDRAPQATTLLVADLPASAALAFPQAVRLARPHRAVDVEIASLVPRVMPDADDLSTVTFVEPGLLELRRRSGYLTSYLERALEGPRMTFHDGQSVERRGYVVTISATDPSGRPLTFRIRLSEPAGTVVLARGERGLEVVKAFGSGR